MHFCPNLGCNPWIYKKKLKNKRLFARDYGIGDKKNVYSTDNNCENI